MSNKVKIAIDAMSGENAPNKIIDGIEISLKLNNENFFYIYGDEDLLKKEISNNELVSRHCEIINAKDVILDDESPLTAAKRGKQSSMWKAIESLKENKTHISLSAGNTGALLIMSRLLLKTIDGISKPALAALAIFTFTSSWNNFLWPLVVVNKPDLMTIQVGLNAMKGEIIPWGILMAGTFISAFPLAVMYVLLQRLFVQGIVTSGIKG